MYKWKGWERRKTWRATYVASDLFVNGEQRESGLFTLPVMACGEENSLPKVTVIIENPNDYCDEKNVLYFSECEPDDKTYAHIDRTQIVWEYGVLKVPFKALDNLAREFMLKFLEENQEPKSDQADEDQV